MLLKQTNLSEKILLNLMNKQAFTDDELLLVLKHPTAITTELLQKIMELPSIGNRVLFALVAHPKVSHQLIHTIISHNEFSLELGEAILSGKEVPSDILNLLAKKAFDKLALEPGQKWEDFLYKVINKYKLFDNSFLSIPSKGPHREVINLIGQKKELINASFALKLFKLLKQPVLHHLPVSDMIKIVTEVDVGLFISLNITLSPQDMMELVKKANGRRQIDTLLHRSEMNSELAAILFEKAEYNGKIAAWDWLTQEQLLNTLDKTRDYQSLYRALTHSNLSQQARQSWLDKMNEQQKSVQGKAPAAINPQQKVMLALNKLKIKAVTHAIKSIDNAKYVDVANTAFDLYTLLEAEAKNYFKQPDAANSRKFKRTCQDAIDKATPVLEIHRGYKQLLLDILNVLLAVFSLFKKGKWRFFETETESVKTVNQVNEIINEQLPEQPGL